MAASIEWQRWWKQEGKAELRDLLAEWWEPAGVGHAAHVGRLLRNGTTPHELTVYFAEQDFGHEIDVPRDRLAAQKVLEWFDESVLRFAPAGPAHGTALPRPGVSG